MADVRACGFAGLPAGRCKWQAQRVAPQPVPCHEQWLAEAVAELWMCELPYALSGTRAASSPARCPSAHERMSPHTHRCTYVPAPHRTWAYDIHVYGPSFPLSSRLRVPRNGIWGRGSGPDRREAVAQAWVWVWVWANLSGLTRAACPSRGLEAGHALPARAQQP